MLCIQNLVAASTRGLATLWVASERTVRSYYVPTDASEGTPWTKSVFLTQSPSNVPNSLSLCSPTDMQTVDIPGILSCKRDSIPREEPDRRRRRNKQPTGRQLSPAPVHLKALPVLSNQRPSYCYLFHIGELVR